MTLFPGMDEFMAEKDNTAESNYAKKMLRKIMVSQFGEEATRQKVLEASTDFGVAWFNDEMECPVTIMTKRKVKPDLSVLLTSKGFTKSDLWKAYFDALAECEAGATMGLIFYLPGCGQYVMHNCHRMPLVPGYNSIVRQARSADKALYVYPFNAFLVGLKEIWLRQ